MKDDSTKPFIGQDSYRRILGVVEGHKEDKPSWLAFLKELKERG